MEERDPHEIEGLDRPRPARRSRRGLRVVLAIGVVVAGLGAGLLSPYGQRGLAWIKRQVREARTSPEQVDRDDILRQAEARLRERYEREIEELRQQIERAEAGAAESDQEESLPPLTAHTAKTGGDVRKLRSDISLETQVEVTAGGVASAERRDDASYRASYTLRVRVPQAATQLEELERVSPDLAAALPGLPGMLEQAEVSRWFYQLYENKTERLKRRATELSELLSRHNFYDCETILNLRHPESRQRVFLLQAEMDVVSDGSDGDRLATMPDRIVNSTYYQPFTSYGWKKRTATPNPMIEGWRKRIGNAEEELQDPETSAARKDWLRKRMDYLKRGIEDMKYRSFLIAEYDPFIVIPVNLLTSSGDPYCPLIGDYAVVLHDGVLYPAIVGDGGPSFKVGEASLRLARQINERASPYRRPVSDLTVTYLVFPGSREKTKEPPDYAKWHRRCWRLLGRIGGVGEGYELFEWENLLPQAEGGEEEAEEAEEQAEE